MNLFDALFKVTFGLFMRFLIFWLFKLSLKPLALLYLAFLSFCFRLFSFFALFISFCLFILACLLASAAASFVRLLSSALCFLSSDFSLILLSIDCFFILSLPEVPPENSVLLTDGCVDLGVGAMGCVTDGCVDLGVGAMGCVTDGGDGPCTEEAGVVGDNVLPLTLLDLLCCCDASGPGDFLNLIT